MNKQQKEEIKEAILLCVEEEISRENIVTWVQDNFTVKEVFDSIAGPIPEQWIQEVMDVILCPLCPEWTTPTMIGPDFFGEMCEINGVRCCVVCHDVYYLTAEEE